jgi:antirestriction protein
MTAAQRINDINRNERRITMNEQEQPIGLHAEGPLPRALAPETHEAEPRDGPRIYVASLSDYNAGILHGQWIEAVDDAEVMQDEIDTMLQTSPTTARYGEIAEEWAIHDYQGFGNYHLGEFESLGAVTMLARAIVERGQAISAWAAHLGSITEAVDQFEDAYFGEWDSPEAYAEDYLDSCGITAEIERVVPDHLQPYVSIDTEALARDLELGGEMSFIERPDGGVWAFGN